MSDNQLALRNTGIINNYDDAERAAVAMAKSGFFTDAADASKAIVKILAGRELGFGAFASMTGIFIIKGKPSLSANLMAAAVKGSTRYDYRVCEMTDEACELAFFEKGVEVGRSRFTAADARRAETQNMGKFPRNMLFARAMSNGAKWYCPDLFSGAAVYTPEELGATTDEYGNVLDLKVTMPEPVKMPEPDKPASAPAAPAQPEQARMSIETAEAEMSKTANAPYGTLPTATLSQYLHGLTSTKKPPTDEQKLKADAIRVILDARSHGRPVQTMSETGEREQPVEMDFPAEQ